MHYSTSNKQIMLLIDSCSPVNMMIPFYAGSSIISERLRQTVGDLEGRVLSGQALRSAWSVFLLYFHDRLWLPKSRMAGLLQNNLSQRAGLTLHNDCETAKKTLHELFEEWDCWTFSFARVLQRFQAISRLEQKSTAAAVLFWGIDGMTVMYTALPLQ